MNPDTNHRLSNAAELDDLEVRNLRRTADNMRAAADQAIEDGRYGAGGRFRAAATLLVEGIDAAPRMDTHDAADLCDFAGVLISRAADALARTGSDEHPAFEAVSRLFAAAALLSNGLSLEEPV